MAIDDNPSVKIGKHFEKTTRKIFDIIKTGGRVLVTCRAGNGIYFQQVQCHYISVSPLLLHINQKPSVTQKTSNKYLLPLNASDLESWQVIPPPGISRSSTMVIAFLMRYKNMPLTDAHKLVKAQRPKVRFNFVVEIGILIYRVNI